MIRIFLRRYHMRHNIRLKKEPLEEIQEMEPVWGEITTKDIGLDDIEPPLCWGFLVNVLDPNLYLNVDFACCVYVRFYNNVFLHYHPTNSIAHP